MKKLLTFLFALQFIFISCEKDNENEFPCPVVDAKVVPVIVKNAFEAKYPTSTVEIWFNKDNTGYCAYFMLNTKKTLVHFKNDGTFIKEEAQDQNGNHQNNNEDEGCECEVDD